MRKNQELTGIVRQIQALMEDSIPGRGTGMCPKCEFPIRLDYQFCPNCGNRLNVQIKKGKSFHTDREGEM